MKLAKTAERASDLNQLVILGNWKAELVLPSSAERC